MDTSDRQADDELVCQELVELVTAYLEGALGPRGRARFEAHLAECEHCTMYLDQFRQTIWLAGHLEPPPLASEQRARLLELFGGLR